MKKTIDIGGKKILLIMIGVVVLGILGTGYFAGRNAMMKKQQKLMDKIHIAEIEKKDTEIDSLAKDIEIGEGKIEELKGDKSKLKEELEQNEEELKELKEKIKDAKPKTLLAESRRILGTREIWLITRTDGDLTRGVSNASATGAEFSLEAFRKATWVFTDWENFTLVREPKYKEKGAKDDKIILEQGTVIGALKITNLKWEEKYGILYKMHEDWKKYVNKKQSIWKWLGERALTFGAGYLFGKLERR